LIVCATNRPEHNNERQVEQARLSDGHLVSDYVSHVRSSSV